MIENHISHAKDGKNILSNCCQKTILVRIYIKEEQEWLEYRCTNCLEIVLPEAILLGELHDHDDEDLILPRKLTSLELKLWIEIRDGMRKLGGKKDSFWSKIHSNGKE